jgi:hypothetical protein
MKNELIKVKLEKLKIEYDHCEKVVWNVLWIISIVTAIMIVGILKGVFDFYTAIFWFALFCLALTIGLFPVAKKSDSITKKEIPELIKELEK